MSDGLSSLESRVVALERIVQALEHRVASIEHVPLGSSIDAALPVRDVAVAEPSAATVSRIAGTDLVSVLSMVGRTCMILGGAYLLRALTEAGSWPTSVGVASGFAYAMLWLGAADRAGAHGRRLSATFFGAVAVAIALPLLWEAVTLFRLIG